MARIGEAREQRGDLALVVADDDRRPARRRSPRRVARRPGPARGIVPLPRRGAVRAGHDDRLVRAASTAASATKSPERPPDFSSNRTDSITMSRWSAFAMS